jgi:ribosomal protein L29
MSKAMDELNKKNDKELKQLLAEKREELRDFRFSMKGSRIRNTKGGAALRKDIARILGLMKERTTTSTTSE